MVVVVVERDTFQNDNIPHSKTDIERKSQVLFLLELHCIKPRSYHVFSNLLILFFIFIYSSFSYLTQLVNGQQR